MTSRLDAVVGLDKVEAPKLIESLSESEIAQNLLSTFQAAFPEFADATEYDPVRALLHVAAMQELTLRQRINDAAAAALLVTATGGDLDVHGRAFGVERKVITPADEAAIPPTPAVMESDDDYRSRIQLAPESWSVAGPENAYIFWAKAAERVKDARAISPSPAVIDLFIMSTEENGEADQALCDNVHEILEDKRPVADRLTVRGAEAVDFAFEARLTLREGPAPDIVLAEAKQGLADLLAERYLIGQSLHLSNLYAAITVEGVEKAEIIAPEGGLSIEPHQFARLGGEAVFHIV